MQYFKRSDRLYEIAANYRSGQSGDELVNEARNCEAMMQRNGLVLTLHLIAKKRDGNENTKAYREIQRCLDDVIRKEFQPYTIISVLQGAMPTTTLLAATQTCIDALTLMWRHANQDSRKLASTPDSATKSANTAVDSIMADRAHIMSLASSAKNLQFVKALPARLARHGMIPTYLFTRSKIESKDFKPLTIFQLVTSMTSGASLQGNSQASGPASINLQAYLDGRTQEHQRATQMRQLEQLFNREAKHLAMLMQAAHELHKARGNNLQDEQNKAFS